jgi:hypothetical protein
MASVHFFVADLVVSVDVAGAVVESPTAVVGHFVVVAVVVVLVFVVSRWARAWERLGTCVMPAGETGSPPEQAATRTATMSARQGVARRIDRNMKVLRSGGIQRGAVAYARDRAYEHTRCAVVVC